MRSAEQAETINHLKNYIDEYSNPNKDFESGVLRGLFYAIAVAENGKEYADKKVDMKNP